MNETYTPPELEEDAKFYYDTFNEDLKNYESLKRILEKDGSEEADKLLAFWTFADGIKRAKALSLVAENGIYIDQQFGDYDAQNVFDFMIYRLNSFYELLKINGVIDE